MSVATPLSVAEAANLLGLSERRVRQLIETGTLPSRKLGRRVHMIDPADLKKITVYGKPGRPKSLPG